MIPESLRHAILAGIALAVGALVPAAAFAQPAPAQWQSVAKIRQGSCGDGAVASVQEQPASMKLTLVYANGTKYADFTVSLAGDGSGKADFLGNAGKPAVMQIPKGTGKRPFITTQESTGCRWEWMPR